MQPDNRRPTTILRMRLTVVMLLLQVLEQPGAGRLPAEQLAGDRGVGRAIQPDEVPERPEMVDGLALSK